VADTANMLFSDQAMINPAELTRKAPEPL